MTGAILAIEPTDTTIEKTPHENRVGQPADEANEGISVSYSQNLDQGYMQLLPTSSCNNANPSPAQPIPVVKEIIKKGVSREWSAEDGRQILLAMARMQDDVYELSTARFWRGIIDLSVSWTCKISLTLENLSLIKSILLILGYPKSRLDGSQETFFYDFGNFVQPVSK